MTMINVSAAGRAQCAGLLDLVVAELAGAGLDAGPPCGDGQLPVACAKAQCAVAVSAGGLAECVVGPWPGRRPGPQRVADLATALLTGRAGEFAWVSGGYEAAGLTLKGVAGQELAARGMRVGLEAHADEARLSAASAVVATHPDAVYPAVVLVRDDGGVTWSCDYGDHLAMAARGRGGYVVAALIAATVTAAVSQTSHADRMRLR